MPTKGKPIPDGYTSITPHLVVRNAAGAIDFYKKAFGAVEIFRHTAPGSDTIFHAELKIGNAILMLCDEFPQMGAVSPQALNGTPTSFYLYVEDVDAVFNRAVECGAKVLLPVEDKFYGDRNGSLEDPFGHKWAIATHKEDLTPEELEQRSKEFMEKQKKS